MKTKKASFQSEREIAIRMMEYIKQHKQQMKFTKSGSRLSVQTVQEIFKSVFTKRSDAEVGFLLGIWNKYFALNGQAISSKIFFDMINERLFLQVREKRFICFEQRMELKNPYLEVVRSDKSKQEHFQL